MSERLPAEEALAFPLSFGQQRLWLLDRLLPDRAAYNVPVFLAVHGPLCRAALAEAFAAVVERHEILRTTFATLEGEPVQVVGEPCRPPLPLIDLQGLPAARRGGEAALLAAHEAGRPFDLAAGPLLRLTLLCLAPSEHHLLLDLHHIVCDEWSLGVLLREVGAAYRAAGQGRALALPELPLQYADFAVWQREGEGETEAALAAARERLAGAPTLLELPLDRPRSATTRLAAGAVAFALDPASFARLKAWTAEARGSVFMLLAAAFGALLARYGGRRDLLLGSPAAYRHRSELEGLVGFFVNTLVLRLSPDPALSWGDYFAATRRDVLAAFAQQEVPFERLVAELAEGRGRGGPAAPPLVQALFTYEGRPAEPPSLPGLALSPLATPAVSAKFEINLNAGEHGGGLAGALTFWTDLFDHPTAARMAGHLTALLAAVAADPRRRLGEIPLSGEAERHQLLAEWNDTDETFSGAGPLHDLFLRQAGDRPDAIAAVAVYGEEQLSYGELAVRSGRLASWLAARGVQGEERVAVALERSLALPVGLLGILRAGGAYVPLDPGQPAARLTEILDDAAPALVLTERRLAAAIPASEIACLDEIDAVGDRGERGRPEKGLGPSSPVPPAHLAALIYTSGSTGRPKGVMVPHAGPANRLLWSRRAYPVTPDDRVLQKAPLVFDISVWEIFGPLAAGATVVLLPPGDHLHADRVAAALERHGITLVHSVPSMLAALADEPAFARAPLRYLFSGGEALPLALRDRLLGLIPGGMHNQYGPTEASIDVTFGVAGAPDPSFRSASLGRPLANCRSYVMDAAGAPVPPGGLGELWIGGDGVTRGYWRRPEATAAAFVPDPFGAPGGRLYRTGDRVRHLADGRLEYAGRLDGQVKVRGVRIETGEIEAVLSSLPRVREAAVALQESSAGPRLVAYVALTGSSGSGGAGGTGRADAPERLRQALRRRLPEALVPAVFVELAALPRTPSGKLDRAALPALLPDAATGPLPEGPVEEALAAIWAEVLKRPAGEAGPPLRAEESFFALGGHSLLAAQMATRVRDRLGCEVPLAEIFEHPTIRSLAAWIGERTGREAATALPPRPPGLTAFPLSHGQERLWLLDRLLTDRAAYNVPAALLIEGPLDAVALAAAFAAVVARHEVLRTTFAVRERQVVQVVDAGPSPALVLVDLSRLPAVLAEREAGRLTGEEAHRPFDLELGPVARTTLVRLAAAEHHFLFTLHHIASDEWSMALLVGEIAAFYRAATGGPPVRLPRLAAQYADFALWQRSAPREIAESDRQMDYWRSQLAGAPRLLELPVDRPWPAAASLAGGSVPVELPAGSSARLEALATTLRATPFMLLAAAYGAVLSRFTGQPELLLGTPAARRDRRELEGVAGFFLNTLPLRLRLEREAPWTRLVARVRETTLAAFAHQEVPFERLVAELAPGRGAAASPLVQTLFAYASTPATLPELPGLVLTPLAVSGGAAKFELTLHLGRTGDRILGAFSFWTDLFDSTTVARLAAHLERFLAAATLAPDRPLEELGGLSEAERHQLLREWNDSDGPEAMGLRLEELFARRAEAVPDAIAVVFEGEHLSYGELLRRSLEVADGLALSGVGFETRVGLAFERSLGAVTGLLGVLATGAVAVFLDPWQPAERRAALADDAGVALILPEAEGRQAGEPTGRPARRAFPTEGLAAVLYTSGSTGKPKGVLLTHRGLVRRLLGTRQTAAPAPGDRVLHKAPEIFDIALWEVLAPLLAGATVVIARPGGHRDTAYLAELVRRERVTLAHFIPSILKLYLEEPGAAAPTDLRALFSGGEALPFAVRDRAALLGALPYNQYGPTEASIDVASGPAPGGVGDGGAFRSVAIGRPLEGAHLFVVDPALRPVPLGVLGELVIGGVHLARGYGGDAARTAERFVPDPFGSRGGRLYRTGDRARHLADGRLEHAGRLDRQVKLRGVRIEPGEIEAALLALPGVREAAVVVRATPGGEAVLAAYVSPPEPGGVAPAGLRDALRQHLPEALVPVFWTGLSALPRTPSGKLDRDALPDPGVAPRGSRPPEGPIEPVLARLWGELLGVEDVGTGDDFFALGGHSLKAIRLSYRMREAFGVELPVTAVFEDATLEGLAGRLEAALQGPRAVSAEEREAVLGASRARTPPPPARSLAEIFGAQAVARPEAPAVTFEGRHLSYGELEVRTRRLARHLLELGVGPEAPVALLCERTPELVVALLAVLRAGAAYVPLDPRLPEERLRHLLADCGTSVILKGPGVTLPASLAALSPEGDLLVGAGLGARGDGRPARGEGIDDPAQGGSPAQASTQTRPYAKPRGEIQVLDLADPEPCLEGEGADLPEVDPALTAYWIYTSGSTGNPKPVAVPHAQVARLLDSSQDLFRFGPEEVWTLFHSYAFDFSVWEIWGALAHGGRLVIVPYAVSRSPADFTRLLAEQRVTVLNQTPSAFYSLAAHQEQSGVRVGPDLAWVIFGGEPLETARLAGWWERRGGIPKESVDPVGDRDRRPRLVNMYGITETTVHVTFHEVAPGEARGAGTAIGRPLPDLALYVLDPAGEPCPREVTGELAVGGAGVARGYAGRPELTAARFVPDAFSGTPGARLYLSGDLGRLLADGRFEHQGRADRQVKIRGFRIEPGEIEAVLSSHPGVAQAAVVARDERLVAYLVPAGPPPGSDALRGFLAARLPGHMVPAAFVTLPHLPLTANGKLDLSALPAPGEERRGGGPSFEEPAGAVEQALAAIWREVLEIDRVGRGDDFFNLGGHSLLALQVEWRIRDAFAVGLPLSAIFEHSRLAALAGRIERELATGTQEPLAPLVRLARRDEAPLSPAQERLWFLDRLHPGNPAYNVSFALRIRGPFSPAAFDAALAALVARHESLRTTFAARAESAVQILAPRLDLGASHIDLTALPSGAADTALAALSRAEAERPFDLGRGPLLRATVVALGREEHALSFSMHHIVSDAWSMGILVREITHLYANAAGREPVELPEPEFQYADFAADQRRWIDQPAGRRQLAYWRRRLEGLVPLELPADRPYPPVQSLCGAAAKRALSAVAVEAVARLTRGLAATPFSPLAATFLVLLARLTARERRADVAVGTVVSGRSRPETREMIGYFVNTLILRTEIDLAAPLEAALCRVHDAAQEAFDHQEMPFESLVEELAPERDLGRSPLADAVFSYHAPAEAAAAIPGLELWEMPLESSSAKQDLTLHAAGGERGVELVLEYSTDRYDRATAERWLGLYEGLLLAFAAAPEAPVAELAWLGTAERSEVLAAGAVRQAAGDVPSLAKIFTVQATRRPAAIALSLDGSHVSYGELDRRSRRLAGWLVGMRPSPPRSPSPGLPPPAPGEGEAHPGYPQDPGPAGSAAFPSPVSGEGTGERDTAHPDTVALFCERTPEMIVAILAVLRAGAAYVPLDPRLPEERLRYLLEDCGASVIIKGPGVTLPASLAALSQHGDLLVGAGLGARGDGRPARGEDIDGRTQAGAPPQAATQTRPYTKTRGEIRVLDLADLEPRLEDEGADLPTIDPALTAYWIYTSGSTGNPKPVAVPHAQVARLLSSSEEHFDFGPDDVWTLFHSYAFDFSLWEIWGALAYGGRLVIVPHLDSRSPEAVARILDEQRVTVLNQTPSAFYQLIAHEEQARAAVGPALRWVIFGGEPLEVGRLAPWWSRHDESPSLVNMYGITETTVHVTFHEIAPDDGRGLGTAIGRPLPDLALYVLDPLGEPRPVGVPGELAVGGTGLARGYPGRPELTASRFVPDPFGGMPGSRLYLSGDLGRLLAGGRFEHWGRVDRQVKIRGFRIEPGEIEAALTAHPQVAAAAVAVRGDRLVAYAVPRDGAVPGTEALRGFLAARLPGHMVPAAFVSLDRLPLTANGKLDLAALPEPAGERPELGGAYVAPRTTAQKALAALWSELLGVDRVGLSDDFFALGGHSLLALRVEWRIRETLGVELPLTALFERSTLEALAERVERALEEAPAAPSVPFPRLERTAGLPIEAPLSFAQQRLWFLHRLEPGDATYNMPFALAIGGTLDRRALAAALTEIVRRHEVLRTVYIAGTEEPRQRVLPVPAHLLPLVDLAGLPAGRRRDEAAAALGEIARRPFDLGSRPPLRAALIALAADDHLAALTLHHIAGDAWSLEVLARELAVLYAAFREGRPSPLPDLPAQYGDFALWQRTRLAGEALARHLFFWRDQLAGAPAAHSLPLDRPRTPGAHGRAGGRSLALGEEVAARVREAGRELAATPFMVLLAAWQALVARLGGETDLVVGVPIAQRARPEVEGLIGFFVNSLALRADLGGEPSFAAHLSRVRQTTLGAFAHQDLPFERLVEELAPERDRHRQPIFQLGFTLDGPPVPAPALPGLRVEPLGGDGGLAKLDLDLAVTLGEGGLTLALSFDTGLFDATTAERHLRYLARLLDAALAAPARPLAGIDLLDEAERHQVALEWSGEPADPPASAGLPGLFFRRAELAPDAVAAVDPDGALSYGELARRARRVAAGLAVRIAPETPVGALLPPSTELAVAFWGVLAAGGAWLPLDPQSPRERLAAMVEAAGAPLVLTSPQGRTRLPPALRAMSLSEVAAEGDLTDFVCSPYFAEALAWVVFTSGSTGRPKAVGVAHEAALFHLSGAVSHFGLTAEDRALATASPAFDVSFEQTVPILLAGGTLLLRGATPLEPVALTAELLASRATVMDLPTAFLPLWLDAAEPHARELALRLVTAGGEGMPVSLARRHLGGGLAAVPLWNAYGPTEATVSATFLSVDGAALGGGTPDVPLGRPLPGRTAQILDPQGRPAPVGVPGELALGGRGLARGYLGRPAETARLFVPDPAAGVSTPPGARLYRTGDRARFRPDGTIEFLGRLDRQVKLRGFRIEPGEIEATLLAHAGVREAAVVPVPVEGHGDGGELRLAAYVVARDDSATTAGLRAFLAGRLPPALVPATFTILPALPRTVSGKLDRRALPSPAQAEGPAATPPQGPTEEALAELWRDLLGVAHPGREDGFFALGGHSLLATRLLFRLRERFGVELPLADVFDHPSLAELAARIDSLRPGAAAVVPGVDEAPGTPSSESAEPAEPSQAPPASAASDGSFAVVAIPRKRHRVQAADLDPAR